MLQAIISLENIFLRQPNGDHIPEEILNNFRFYPYFKVLIATHVNSCIALIGSPENPVELFNLRHASLRNFIERAFGVLKKRFPIISRGTEPQYPIKTLTEIVLAFFYLAQLLSGCGSR